MELKQKSTNDQSISIRKLVIKLGTKQITDIDRLNENNIRKIVGEIAEFRKLGVEITLVVSGAVGLGRHFLKDKINRKRKMTISDKQALAGHGQFKLMKILQHEFEQYHIPVGQALLTHYIFENRDTYLNAVNTVRSMHQMGILPVINENDTVATDEIKLGDNDRLGAYVSLLVDADCYLILSDIDGLYENYGKPEQQLISCVRNIQEIEHMASGKKESFTSGGMKTKLSAARISTSSGTSCIIANGFKENILKKAVIHRSEGTLFLPFEKNLCYRKRWITGKKPRGEIKIDSGAVKALKNHKSLLPSGIISVAGNFRKRDIVCITDEQNHEIARGLSNFDDTDMTLIIGKQSSEISEILHIKKTAAVHTDDMVLTEGMETCSIEGNV